MGGRVDCCYRPDNVSRDRVQVRFVHAHAVTAGTFILLLPNILFAMHLRPWAAVAVLVGSAAAAVIALRSTSRHAMSQHVILAQPLVPLRLAVCVALATLLLALGGEGHLAFSNWDWLWRDAVLSDLARAPFPPAYSVDGQTALLRAPLGMYMLPALVASATRLAGGHAALFVQNALFLALVLYVLATLAGRAAVTVCATFVLFSGLDIVGEWLTAMLAGASVSVAAPSPSHIENWMPILEYSSVVTQIFWVPNHALPSYWLALLAWLCRRGDVPLGLLVASGAAALIWSPFAVIGALPLGFYLFARAPKAALRSWPCWAALLAAACFAPVALYLQADAEMVPHALMLLRPGWWAFVVFFLAVEIPQAVVVALGRRHLPRDLKGLVATSVAVLVVLPTLRFGFHNDLVSRASIPALALLSIGFAQTLRTRGPGSTGRLVAPLVLASIGAVTPLTEISRALAFAPFAISDCNLVTVWKTLEPDDRALASYLTRPSPTLEALFSNAVAPSLSVSNAVCWPDLPFDPRLPIDRLSNEQLLRLPQKQGTPVL